MHRERFLAVWILLIGGLASSYGAFFGVLPTDYDEEVMVLALQGLVNRNEPQLLLNTSTLFWPCSYSDTYWLSYFQQKKGIKFQTLNTTSALLNQFSPIFKGLAVYDTQSNADATRYLAMMYASFQTLLPVTPTLISKFPTLQSLPILVDTRGEYPNTENGEVLAWEYAIAKIFPNCTDKTFAYSVGRSHGNTDIGGDAGVQIGLDLPVQLGAFIFNLSPNKDKYPTDAMLFDTVMAGPLITVPAIYGWAEPEQDFTDRVTNGGGYVMCDGAPNLSFWHKVNSTAPVLPSARTSAPEAPYTVVFQTNEGDTPKIVASLMAGQWISPTRGQSYVSWGINPGIAVKFPALIEYYANTASFNDSFFAGCSGSGYVYPSRFTPQEMTDYFQHVHETLGPLGAPAVVDIWDYSIDPKQLLKYRSIVPEIQCFTFQSKGVATNLCMPDKTPVMQSDNSLFYPVLNDTNRALDLYNRIINVANEHPPPFTILIYGLLNRGADHLPQVTDLALAMSSMLPKDKFTIMPITQACTQAQQRCSA